MKKRKGQILVRDRRGKVKLTEENDIPKTTFKPCDMDVGFKFNDIEGLDECNI